MDPSTAVTTSVAISLFGFAVVIFLLLFLIAKWKWHVFFALLIPIIFFGVLPGVQRNNFIDAFESGFGNTLGSIGVVIVFGVSLATLITLFLIPIFYSRVAKRTVSPQTVGRKLDSALKDWPEPAE